MAPWLRGLASQPACQEEQLQPCDGNGNGNDNGNNIKRVYTMSDQLICQLPPDLSCTPPHTHTHWHTHTHTHTHIGMRSQAWTALGQWTHAMAGHYHLPICPPSRPPPTTRPLLSCSLFTVFQGVSQPSELAKKMKAKNHNHCILAGAAAVIIQ